MFKINTTQKRYFLLISIFAFIFLMLFFLMIQLIQKKAPIYFINVISQTFLSFPFLLLVAFTDYQIINWTSSKSYFNHKFILRLFIDLLLGAMLSILMTLMANIAFSGAIVLENIFTEYLFNVPAIAGVFINSLMIFLLEFLILYDKQRAKEIEIIQLKSENSEYLYNQLRSQINPHFLFNSLNVLTALIHKDSQKAVLFTKKLSNIYRYVLNHDRAETIVVRKELDFAQTYIEVLKIRFGNHLHFSYDLTENELQRPIPPMTFQFLIENAVKHNIISNEKSLHIKIYTSENSICIENNKNPILSQHQSYSSGIGLVNLNNRFKLACNCSIFIENLDDIFIVKIPLL